MRGYWEKALKHSWEKLREHILGYLIAALTVGIGYALYRTQGLQDAYSTGALYGLAIGAAVLSLLFLGHILFFAPIDIDEASSQREKTLQSEVETLHGNLSEIRNPRLQFELRQEDTRYIRVIRVPGSLPSMEIRQGLFSIENRPGQSSSVEEVIVLLSDIIGGGEDLRDLRNVHLRFEGQLPNQISTTIHPGQKKFVSFVHYQTGHSNQPAQLYIPHAGNDGLSGGSVHISPEHHYTAKIHISARNMPLLSTTVRFGGNNGRFFFEQGS